VLIEADRLAESLHQEREKAFAADHGVHLARRAEADLAATLAPADLVAVEADPHEVRGSPLPLGAPATVPMILLAMGVAASLQCEQLLAG